MKPKTHCVCHGGWILGISSSAIWSKENPAHFQRTIDAILGAYLWHFVLAYIDDIVIFSRTFEDHMKHVSLIFDALHNVGFTVDE